MKKIKYLILLLLPFLFINIIYAEESNNYKYILEDDANLLSNIEENDLRDMLKKLTQYGNIIVKTISINQYNSAMEYAENYYSDIFGSESGSIFLIDMDNRYLWIYSDGYNYDKLTENKVESITSNSYKYASKNEYYECISITLNQMYKLLGGEKINETMRIISNLLIGLFIGYFLAYVYLLFRTRNKGITNKEIIDNVISNVVVSNVNSIKKNTTRRYSPISSDSSGSHFGGGHSGGSHSSGGHSGGGHSGGGHSGGGGGHRF